MVTWKKYSVGTLFRKGRKTIASPESKEVAVLLESLDENSIVFVRTYMTALADRKKLENAKLAAAEV